MLKNLFIVFCFTLSSLGLFGQAFWKKANEERLGLRNISDREIIPEKYEVFSLEKSSFRKYLEKAPHENDVNRKSKDLLLEIPMPDGSLEIFKVYEVSIMEPELAAKFPSIKTYKGYAINGKATQLYFDITPNGFHASISNLHEEFYIDPYALNVDEHYIVYRVEDHKTDVLDGKKWCGVDDSEHPTVKNFRPGLRNSGPVTRYDYRMAVACTGEWGARRNTVEGALADINTIAMRLNAVYEKDIAVRFVLVANNDKLIFLNPSTDPFENPQIGRDILRNNTSLLNSIIGSNAYDIGHILTINCTDGILGVAALGSLCQSNKGNGVTCHGESTISKTVIETIAHEVGHQFDASHTWNRCADFADQRAGGTAFEPGSGTTIMSYGHACGTDRIADIDYYFHVGSIVQMTNKVRQGGNAFACAEKTTTSNTFPELNMPPGGWVIPISTPFELEGSAIDAEGDDMVFNWEQYDAGVTATPLGTATETGPLFRSVAPSANGFYRIFPRAFDFFAPNPSTRSEVLPIHTRELNFMLTVRDYNESASGVVWDRIKFNTTDQAGPFRITSPSSGLNLNIREKVKLEWDVANTDKAPVNCSNVDIYASIFTAGATPVTRSGDANLIPLAMGIPNTGSYEVDLPDLLNQRFRFVIKASDNIFLTGSPSLLRIVGPTEPAVFFTSNVPNITICQPTTPDVQLTAVGFGGYTGDVEFSIVGGIPDGSEITLDKNSVKVGEKISININTDNVVGAYSGNLVIRVIAAGIDTFDKLVPLEIIPGNIDNVELVSPASNNENVSSVPMFEWSSKPDAINYDLQIATNPSFSAATIVAERNTNTLNLNSPTILQNATVYYWRTRANNSCRNGEWSETRAFLTEALSCKDYESGERSINISATGRPTVEIELNIPESGVVSQLIVNKILISHARNSDIKASIVAPSGKAGVLWSGQCSTQRDVNLGLNDSSPLAFACPLNAGRVMQTHRNADKLEVFKGESMQGSWKLVIEDMQAGSAGVLRQFDMQICASFSPDKLSLVNQGMKVHPADGKTITQDYLSASNPNNANQIVSFALVSLPSFGTLFFNGVEASPGLTFTNADITSGALRYRSVVDYEGQDSFTFTVSNGAGAWVGVTPFIIDVLESEPVSVDDTLISSDIYLYPNPTNGFVNVVLTGKATDFNQFEIYDVTGRIMHSGQFTQLRNELDIQSYKNGVYLIKIHNGQRSVYKKITKLN